MKEENVLNVLMYLFENHMKDSCTLDRDANSIVHALEKAGFASTVISEAIEWLETLLKEDIQLICSPQTTSTRVFTSEEKECIGLECLGLILSLETQGILTPETREIVINQTIALDSELIDASLLKWVVLMVLFNQPNCEKALACMEFLVLDNAGGEVH